MVCGLYLIGLQISLAGLLQYPESCAPLQFCSCCFGFHPACPTYFCVPHLPSPVCLGASALGFLCLVVLSFFPLYLKSAYDFSTVPSTSFVCWKGAHQAVGLLKSSRTGICLWQLDHMLTPVPCAGFDCLLDQNFLTALNSCLTYQNPPHTTTFLRVEIQQRRFRRFVDQLMQAWKCVSMAQPNLDSFFTSCKGHPAKETSAFSFCIFLMSKQMPKVCFGGGPPAHGLF